MKNKVTGMAAFVLAAALCVSFAGCSKKEPVSDGDGSSSQSAGVGENNTPDNGGVQNPDDSIEAGTSTSTGTDATTTKDDMPEKDEDTETSIITSQQEQEPAPSDKGDAIALTAESVLGYDFLYGGARPEDGGFDNPGLVYYALTANGISCARTTKDIMKMEREVSYEQLQRGDIVVFMMDDGSDILFCGIYVGDGTAVMSFSDGIPVKTVDITTNYYRRNFVMGIRAA